MLLDPDLKQKNALAACETNSAVNNNASVLNRSVLAARIENPRRVEGFLESAMQALADVVEGVKDRSFCVAMPKQYGMSSHFCDLVTEFCGRAAAVYPALRPCPVGEDFLFAIQAWRRRRQ